VKVVGNAVVHSVSPSTVAGKLSADGGGGFFLVARRFRSATASDLGLMNGLNMAGRRRAGRSERQGLSRRPDGGKVHDSPFFKAKGSHLASGSGAESTGALAGDAPAWLISLRH